MSMWDKLGKSVAMGAIIISLGAFGCMGGGGGSGNGGGNNGGGNNGGGNNGGGNNGGGNNGGSKLANRLFGGGGAQSGAGGSGAGAGGSGAGGAVVPGDVTVNQASCVVACTEVLDCLVASCEFAVNAADMALGVQECTTECLEAATPLDIAGIANLTANNCAQFNTVAAEENWCGDFDEDDFEPDPIGGSDGAGGTGPVGGSGGPAGDCALFCDAAERCCGEDPECTSVEDMFGTACENICPHVPAEAMSCVVLHANDSCEVLDAECSVEEPVGGSGGGIGGSGVGDGCDESLFCETFTCAQDCFDEECQAECMAPCQEDPEACTCPNFNPAECF